MADFAACGNRLVRLSGSQNIERAARFELHEPAGPVEKPELKMWLAVRTDLELSRGKLAVQAMHAAGWLHLIVAQDRPDLMREYIDSATPKVAVGVGSAAALDRAEREAKAAGIPCFAVADAGRTEIASGTRTVCMFGPAYRDDLPEYLRRLRLLTSQREVTQR